MTERREMEEDPAAEWRRRVAPGDAAGNQEAAREILATFWEERGHSRNNSHGRANASTEHELEIGSPKKQSLKKRRRPGHLRGEMTRLAFQEQEDRRSEKEKELAHAEKTRKKEMQDKDKETELERE
ncbi:hypothetical protein NDU88_004982 [Pleurodeles waltl]|uniref:Uncharacterized protein n=1 Tax=Pleurodeles waltl TaxID=8319 RepID=A0AAV7SKD4_PLEWA|nr:hypothetical protein NDU88_004982 [Pleurodeles waltl]